MQQIKHPTHPPTHNIHHLSTIIYNQYQLPLICDLLSYPLELDDTHLLLPDPMGKCVGKSGCQVGSFCLIIPLPEICPLPQVTTSSIEKLIVLSDRVICIGLEPQLESNIEKMFLAVMPELYAKYASFGVRICKPELCFVNEGYRKVFSRQAQGIYNFRTLKQLTAFLPHKSPQPNQNLPKSPPPPSPTHTLLPLCPPGLPISQLLTLYSSPHLPPQLPQIRYSSLAYKQILQHTTCKEAAQRYLLVKGIRDVNKGVLREIGKIGFEGKDLGELEWKYACLRNFCDLVYEEKVNAELVRKYKTSSLLDLPHQSIILQIRQFHRIWTYNTLSSLRKKFSTIVNRRDSKAITQFRQTYQKIGQILHTCLLHSTPSTQNNTLLQHLLHQTNQFINTHQQLIRNQYLSSVKYTLAIVRYKWKYQPKFFYKMFFFFLLAVLVWIMGSIVGVGVVAVGGVLMLAINV